MRRSDTPQPSAARVSRLLLFAAAADAQPNRRAVEAPGLTEAVDEEAQITLGQRLWVIHKQHERTRAGERVVVLRSGCRQSISMPPPPSHMAPRTGGHITGRAASNGRGEHSEPRSVGACSSAIYASRGSWSPPSRCSVFAARGPGRVASL